MIDASVLPRLLAGAHGRSPTPLEHHLELHGPAPLPGRREVAGLIESLEQSGLRGRGGSGFPPAAKVAAVNAAPRRRRRIVLANGAEGEPTSEKDSSLMAFSPHLVLDGVALAAAAVNADESVICVKSGDADARVALAGAIAERGGIDPITPTVAEVPDGYVAGEETALVNFLNTGSGVPTYVPPRPSERGVGGRPTLVQNVETLAHLALIGRHGPEWFRALGTAEDPGSTLVTINGCVGSPGLYEIPGGLPLDTLVDHVGGTTAPVQAFLVGGYGGTWFPADRSGELSLGYEAMRSQGGSLGPGIVTAFPADACGVAETARIARYLAEHSAEQCGPCTFGMPALAESLQDLADGYEGTGTGWVRHWCARIAGRGACHHPDGAVRMVASAMEVFADDFREHERSGGCAAMRARASGRAAPARAEGR